MKSHNNGTKKVINSDIFKCTLGEASGGQVAAELGDLSCRLLLPDDAVLSFRAGGTGGLSMHSKGFHSCSQKC